MKTGGGGTAVVPWLLPSLVAAVLSFSAYCYLPQMYGLLDRLDKALKWRSPVEYFDEEFLKLQLSLTPQFLPVTAEPPFEEASSGVEPSVFAFLGDPKVSLDELKPNPKLSDYLCPQLQTQTNPSGRGKE